MTDLKHGIASVSQRDESVRIREYDRFFESTASKSDALVHRTCEFDSSDYRFRGSSISFSAHYAMGSVE